MEIKSPYRPGPNRKAIEDAAEILGPDWGGNVLLRASDALILIINISEALAAEVGLDTGKALGSQLARTPDKRVDRDR